MKHFSTLLKAFSLLLLFCATIQSSYGQGNLKFSQTRYIELSGNSALLAIATQTLIIDPNHVGKVENVVGLEALQVSGDIFFTVNDVIYTRAANSSSYNFSPPRFPIWLSAGTYVLKLKSSNNSNTGIIKVAVSMLDFEIIP